MRIRLSIIAAALALSSVAARAVPATVSTLFSRGYTVLPGPREVRLKNRDFRFGEDWTQELAPAVSSDDVAVESLRDGLASRFHILLKGPEAAGAGIIRLEIAANSVSIGEAADRDRQALAEQAYRLVLAPHRVTVTANAPPGLFYGVQTLLQLVKRGDGRLWLPEGEIEDWPDLELREIYWDDAHHLEPLDVLKQAVRQAAFFKINGFAIKLEGHFQYKSAPALVEPYALSAAELQELTDYGLHYYVQVIPYLDGPAHIAFILKHPEYASLREFPDSNYELCVTNPDSYKLLFGMYRDLLDANRGARYFHLSTDEPYYVGLADNAQCHEGARARELGNVGKLLAEFISKTAGFLSERGRRVIFWGEYPLVPGDVASLPGHLINGEVYGPDFDPVFKARGIRQMVYVSAEGEEPLFPNYFMLPAPERLHAGSGGIGRVEEMFEHISYGTGRLQADLMGEVNAGWADAGLNPETFWLGYAAGSAAGWHPGSPDPGELMSAFYPLFYGPDAVQMGRVYQLMSRQAQFWADSWERAPSNARKPIWGNSNRIFLPRRQVQDDTLPLPPVPMAEGPVPGIDWSRENSKRLERAEMFLVENDELLDLLRLNLTRVEFNRYSLEVFVAIARLCRQNLVMLKDLARIDASLKSAEAAGQPYAQALAGLDKALDLAARIREDRNAALHDATETWYKSSYPRVEEANGRRFLHELDDVKDHRPDRTVGLDYLVYRELELPMGDWYEKVLAARNHYAQAHNLALRQVKFDWKNTTAASRSERPPDAED